MGLEFDLENISNFKDLYDKKYKIGYYQGS
jgi:hypothetical protein